ncbi:UNVERIFIED_CONTAM: hypothetical protein K2H54_055710 [Gekko kuhli]
MQQCDDARQRLAKGESAEARQDQEEPLWTKMRRTCACALKVPPPVTPSERIRLGNEARKDPALKWCPGALIKGEHVRAALTLVNNLPEAGLMVLLNCFPDK